MLNVIAIMGRLVADPELRKTNSGISVASFRIACDRSYARSGGERETDFFDVVAWRQSAEFVCKYFRKGSLIAIDGSLQSRNYEDREGKKRTAYEIVANNIHFAESKRDSGGQSYGGGQGYGSPAPGGAPPAARPQVEESPTYSAGSPDDFAVIDDSEDLPF